MVCEWIEAWWIDFNGSQGYGALGNLPPQRDRQIKSGNGLLAAKFPIRNRPKGGRQSEATRSTPPKNVAAHFEFFTLIAEPADTFA